MSYLQKDYSISKLEFLELFIIIMVSILLLQTSISEHFPNVPDWSTFIFYTAGQIFLQSLLRDILILMKRYQSVKMGARETKLCLCAESTLGLTVLFVGILLTMIGGTYPIFLDSIRWCSWITFWLFFSFYIKDYVIHTNPLRIERDPEHMNVLLSWKA